MSYIALTKEEVEKEGLEWKKPVETDTVFLTGPSGKIYEIPKEIAVEYEQVSQGADPAPIFSYDELTKLVDWKAVKQTMEDPDVAGQHMTKGFDGSLQWSSKPEFGPTGDGFACWHIHPYGTPAWVPV